MFKSPYFTYFGNRGSSERCTIIEVAVQNSGLWNWAYCYKSVELPCRQLIPWAYQPSFVTGSHADSWSCLGTCQTHWTAYPPKRQWNWLGRSCIKTWLTIRPQTPFWPWREENLSPSSGILVLRTFTLPQCSRVNKRCYCILWSEGFLRQSRLKAPRMRWRSFMWKIKDTWSQYASFPRVALYFNWVGMVWLSATCVCLFTSTSYTVVEQRCWYTLGDTLSRKGWPTSTIPSRSRIFMSGWTFDMLKLQKNGEQTFPLASLNAPRMTSWRFAAYFFKLAWYLR